MAKAKAKSKAVTKKPTKAKKVTAVTPVDLLEVVTNSLSIAQNKYNSSRNALYECVAFVSVVVAELGGKDSKLFKKTIEGIGLLPVMRGRSINVAHSLTPLYKHVLGNPPITKEGGASYRSTVSLLCKVTDRILKENINLKFGDEAKVVDYVRTKGGTVAIAKLTDATGSDNKGAGDDPGTGGDAATTEPKVTGYHGSLTYEELAALGAKSYRASPILNEQDMKEQAIDGIFATINYINEKGEISPVGIIEGETLKQELAIIGAKEDIKQEKKEMKDHMQNMMDLEGLND